MRKVRILAHIYVNVCLMQFAIPRLLGFDEMFAGAPDIRDSDMNPPF